MRIDMYPRIRRNIEARLDRWYGGKKEMSRNFQWVIQMYLYYAWRAVINGWTIRVMSSSIRPSMKITLEHEPVRKLGKKEKGKYFISNKLFGEMFSLKMEGHQIDPGYIWYPCPKLAKMLQNNLDTDNIYELIKS